MPVEEAADFITAYREELAKGETEVHRGRINFYGYLKAGKSSLFGRLLGEPFDKNIARTEGIDIQVVKITKSNWKKVEVKSTHRRKIKGNKEKDVKEVDNQSANRAKDVSKLQQPVRKRKIPHTADAENKDGAKIFCTNDGSTLRSASRPLVSQNSDSDDDYFVFVWDYGGQTEYYATHHLFLDAEAAHLVVMDVTKKFDEPVDYSYTYMIKSTPTTPKEFLHYWPSSIHFASSKKGIQPSVAIFLTHTDEIDRKKCKEHVKKYKNAILKCLKKTPYKKYISEKNIYDIDNTSTDEAQFLSARRDIHEMIKQQNRQGKKRPA